MSELADVRPSEPCSLQSSALPLERLSERQILFFRQAGYLLLSTRFPACDVTTLRDRLVDEFAAGVEPVRRDCGSRVVRLSRLFERDRLFQELFRSPVIVGPLSSLLGPNVEFVLNRHNHATINHSENKSVRLHRDVLQWSRPVITVIVYLEESAIDSGCTHLIPTSQYLPFVGTPNNGGTWMDEHHVYSDLLGQALPIPVRAGGILVFDSLVFHSAGLNVGDSPRVAITGAYRSVDELAATQSDTECALVMGERLYRGDS